MCMCVYVVDVVYDMYVVDVVYTRSYIVRNKHTLKQTTP
jgi:hypothetical protein